MTRTIDSGDDDDYEDFFWFFSTIFLVRNKKNSMSQNCIFFERLAKVACVAIYNADAALTELSRPGSPRRLGFRGPARPSATEAEADETCDTEADAEKKESGHATEKHSDRDR